MSFLKELREKAQGNPETLVNDQKIEESETNNDVGSETPASVPGTHTDDLTKGNDNDSTDGVEKQEGVGELIELKDVVENDKSLEGNNPIVKFRVEQLNKLYKLGLESIDGLSNEQLVMKLNGKIKKLKTKK